MGISNLGIKQKEPVLNLAVKIAGKKIDVKLLKEKLQGRGEFHIDLIPPQDASY